MVTKVTGNPVLVISDIFILLEHDKIVDLLVIY